MIIFNRGLFIWTAPEPRRWRLVGVHRHGIVYYWHCCTRDKPNESEIRDIVDLLVNHAKGFKVTFRSKPIPHAHS